jgi:hypothetical protein
MIAYFNANVIRNLRAFLELRMKTRVIVLTMLFFHLVLLSFFTNDLVFADEQAHPQIILPKPSLNVNGFEEFYYNISGGILTTREHPLWVTRKQVECRRDADFQSEIAKTLTKGVKLKISSDIAGFPLLQNPLGSPWLQVVEVERDNDRACFIFAKAENIEPIISD